MTDSHLAQVLLLDVALVLVVSRGLGRLAARAGQPLVVAEIVAGILLGPSLLPEAVTATLFPPAVRPLLSALATVGLAWFMFSVGMEIEPRTLRRSARALGSLTIWSFAVPFVLGAGAAVLLVAHHRTADPVAFAVFVGLAVAVTAFPVLARILSDRGMQSSPIGGTALSLAAVIDLVAWIALALLQTWLSGTRSWTALLVLPYAAVLLLGVRPLLGRLLDRFGPERAGRVQVVLFGMALLSGAATEAMGLHFVFGAFLAGVVVPGEPGGAVRGPLQQRAERLTGLLLPAYFVTTGLNVDLSTLRPSDLLDGLLIVAVAVLGKAGGTYLGGRVSGMGRHDARVLAVLVNTRGLTELIILGVGLDAGLLDPSLYAVMVLMAVVTTMMTGPLLGLLQRRRPRAGPGARTPVPSREADDTT